MTDRQLCCLTCREAGDGDAVGDRDWALQHQQSTGHQRFAQVAPAGAAPPEAELQRTFSASFKVRLLVPIDDELLHLGLATIAMVWDHRIGTPQEFTVSVAPRVETEHGDEITGGYVDADRHFAFATTTMFGTREGKVREGLMIRVAAHEAMHAVQHARGDSPVAGLRGSDPKYATDPHEIEANEESVLVLKGFYRDLTKPIPLGGGGRLYEIPADSPYTTLWDEIERRGATVRIKRHDP